MLLAALSLPARAQLCSGSLGDPVVNLTFGAGNNPGQPLTGINHYSFTSAGCPGDGYYTVANYSGDCFGNSWHVVPEDHTPGDVNGYMMIVNASYDPGDFFVKTVDGLCPNTTYEFASWILNILRANQCGSELVRPDVTFRIETTGGTVLQSYSTGSLPETSNPQWKQYGFFFSTPPGITSVVLRMTNNAPGGCGNDLLLDDITFRACGPKVSALINGDTDTTDLCVGNRIPVVIEGTVSAGYSDPAYQWQTRANNETDWQNIPGANSTTYNRAPLSLAGEYSFRLAVYEKSNGGISSCSVVSNEIKIKVHDLPVPDATASGECTGDTIRLNAQDGNAYQWTGPAGYASNTQSPQILNATASQAGWYYVNVSNTFGCRNRDSVEVTLLPAPVVQAGNAVAICEGGQTTLSVNASVADRYAWSPAVSLNNASIANPVASPANSTLYTVTAYNGNCKASDTLTVTVNRKPSAEAGADKAIIAGTPVVLDGVAGGTDISISWSPTTDMLNAGSQTPTVNPQESQTYTLNVRSLAGCGVATDTVRVRVYEKLFVPNAFSPNGDGINDVWKIETLVLYPNAHVRVYDRFGEIVFDNKQKNISWDGNFGGNPVATGTYLYIIDTGTELPLVKGLLFVLR